MKRVWGHSLCIRRVLGVAALLLCQLSFLWILANPVSAHGEAGAQVDQGSAVGSRSGKGSSTTATAASSEVSDYEASRNDAYVHRIYCRNCGHEIGFTHMHVVVDSSLANPALVAGASSAPEISEEATVHNFRVKGMPNHDPTSLFQLGTFSSLKNYALEGNFESKSALFPGYGWTAVMCPHCHVQIGWLFEDVTTDSALKKMNQQKKTNSRKTSDGKSKKQRASSSRGKKSERASRSKVKQKALGAITAQDSTNLLDEDELLESLNRRCLFFPQGYWTVRFCFQHDVIQYHQNPKGNKDPLYSLGTYDTSGRIERPRTLTSGKNKFISHFFTGGQPCDETKRPRTTEVQYLCCPVNSDDLRIAAFDEYSKCKYRMRVCVPSMCEEGANTNEEDSDKVDDEAIAGVSTVEVDASGEVAALVDSAPLKVVADASIDVSNSEMNGDPLVRVDGQAASQDANNGDSTGQKRLSPEKFFALRWGSVITDGSDSLLWSYAAAPVLALSE